MAKPNSADQLAQQILDLLAKLRDEGDERYPPSIEGLIEICTEGGASSSM